MDAGDGRAATEVTEQIGGHSSTRTPVSSVPAQRAFTSLYWADCEGPQMLNPKEMGTLEKNMPGPRFRKRHTLGRAFTQSREEHTPPHLGVGLERGATLRI